MKDEQQILKFACENCSWQRNGLCKGPFNAKSYLLQGENFTGCLDIPKERIFLF